MSSDRKLEPDSDPMSSSAPTELHLGSKPSALEAEGIGKLISEVLPPLASRLETQHLLAEGGMGKIEVVFDAGLERKIAMKVIGRSLRNTEHAVRLFLREAQITAQLDHPAIVPVHEVGLDPKERLFFTMKLVEGATFHDWLDTRDSSTGESGGLYEILEVIIKLCDALSFAHSRGVIHGDIKPANVMVGEYGEVYLMDWGLAHLRGAALTRTSLALSEGGAQLGCGTPAFMASEQARMEPIDERTDVFGLTSLLYFALTGAAPYKGESASEVLSLAREGQFPALNGEPQNATVPPELARIVEKGMSVAPCDRYQSVSELRDELRRFLRGGAEFPLREVATGEHIIRQGETGDEVFILMSGRVRVYQEIGDEIVERGEMGPGDVFGEMAILMSTKRTASVQAIDDCVLRVVTGEILEREVHGMKPWLASLIRTLAARLREREVSE